MSSASSPIYQFGRAWKVTITTFPDAQGNSQIITAFSNSWTPEPLRMTFDCYQTTAGDGFWFGDIALYNLNDPTTQTILKQGMMVKLEAGYQNQPLGTIYEGMLMQPMWERENGVDFKLTLHCIVGLVEQTNNFVALSVAGGLTQRQIVARMASAAVNPLDDSNVNLPSTTTSSRGEVIFGQPLDYFDRIARNQGSNCWFTNQAINIGTLLRSTGAIPTLVYGPGTGLIGTPIQTQDGVEIKVLLDARAQLASQFQLTPSDTIKQFPRANDSYPTILDAKGLYTIAAVRHYGDSRGEDWYTAITGYTYVGSILSLLSPPF
jgi:hypothetical protein